jgi:hypothetical protein
MAEDTAEFAVKVLACKMIVDNLPNKRVNPSRELAIQVHKLERMVTEFNRRFLHMDLPAKTLRKKMGPHLHRLTQQSKRVDGLLLKVWGQMLVSAAPQITPQQKKKMFKLGLPGVISAFNKHIYESAVQFRKSLPDGDLKAWARKLKA